MAEVATQSQRMTTQAEAAYRVQYPNSKRRSTLVVALDDDARKVLHHLLELEWNNAQFAVLEEKPPAQIQVVGLQGSVSPLPDAIVNADVVMMVATHDTPAHRVRMIGELCFRHHVMTAGFVLSPAQYIDELQQTLASVRPYVISLVVESDPDYLVEALRAVRA